MKTTVFWIMAAMLFLSTLAGCGGGQAAPGGTAPEIASKIFTTARVDHFGQEQKISTNEEKEFFLGSADYPAFADAVAVLPMINIDTRLMVIIKAAKAGDVADIMAKLKKNIDPNRLICVTFDLEDVAYESRGDVILMTINSDAVQRKALVDAFNSIQ